MSNKILIVEDEKVLQDVYKLILLSQHYTVFTADNGFEGITKLKKYKPEMVLLDLFMPIMDGKEFMRNINVADYPNTKFVVYTNMSDRETEDEMLKLGADRFILKSSLNPHDLLNLVRDMTTE